MSKLEKITFRPEGEEPVEFYVLEQTRIGGHNYILVTDVEEGSGVFADMLEDVDLIYIISYGLFRAMHSHNPFQYHHIAKHSLRIYAHIGAGH